MGIIKPGAHLRAFTCSHGPSITQTHEVWQTHGARDGSIAKTMQRLSLVPTLRCLSPSCRLFLGRFGCAPRWSVVQLLADDDELHLVPVGAELDASLAP